MPDNLVQWSYKHREFVKMPEPPDIVTIINVCGTMLHKDSDEAKKQLSGVLVGENIIGLGFLLKRSRVFNRKFFFFLRS